MKDSTFEKYKRVIDEWLHNGENGTKAYQSVYPKSSDENAKTAFQKILTFSNLQNYLKEQKEIKAEAVKEAHGVTFESEIKAQLRKKKMFDEILELSSKKDITEKEEKRLKRMKDVLGINGINKAEEMLYRMLGFFEVDNKQTSEGDTSLSAALAKYLSSSNDKK